ncbi:hypothetical protein [Candidatus Amarobacter glycogenicus]|uniref:type I restriction enzyme subunit R domain-containing protein n=1 Tax=Candidatus Amarobacter glycogenicus TaxID=3140699 RepID=UPI0031CC5BCB
MKLLVVVDKLLTGFDAPPCTYLYIDKSMQDHGLFRAICRTNRLDGDDKVSGFVVDYKDLFTKGRERARRDSSKLDQTANGVPEILLQDRLAKGKNSSTGQSKPRSCSAKPVDPPGGELEHIHYAAQHGD